MAWMGRYHRVALTCWIVEGVIRDEGHLLPPAAPNPAVTGAGHVVNLAEGIEGVDEPLVIEVVLALDKTAEFVQQLGVVIEPQRC